MGILSSVPTTLQKDIKGQKISNIFIQVKLKIEKQDTLYGCVMNSSYECIIQFKWH